MNHFSKVLRCILITRSADSDMIEAPKLLLLRNAAWPLFHSGTVVVGFLGGAEIGIVRNADGRFVGW